MPDMNTTTPVETKRRTWATVYVAVSIGAVIGIVAWFVYLFSGNQ